jgi:hypothetical protein
MYKRVVRKSERMRLLGRYKRKLKNNIEVDVKGHRARGFGLD